MRRIFAQLSVDEDCLLDDENDEILGRLEKEFGWLEQSGIFLREALIGDEDDEVDWARYVNYIFEWAFENYLYDTEQRPPYTYGQWWAFNIIRLLANPEEMSAEEIDEHIRQITRYQKDSGMNYRELYRKACSDERWAKTELL